MASTDGGPWFYPDRVSAVPGETVTIHASGSTGRCRLIATRIGAQPTLCDEFVDIPVEHHDIPTDADQAGCRWPATFTFEVGTHWPTGYIDLELIDAEGASTHHFICCRPASPTPGRALLVLATNTYQAYNYWGGSNSYGDVDGLQDGSLDADQSREGAIGRLSRLRPFAQYIIAPPPGAPRLVNMVPRSVGERPIPGDLSWLRAHSPSPYDGAAGFQQRWEHRFASWAETHGYELDFACDHDFERPGGGVLADYDTVVLVGHSEYWSANQRAQLAEFVDGGGGLAVFSGNTGYWKVRWEDDDTTLVAHKWNGESSDPLWGTERQGEATHLWSHPAFALPEAEVTGLSFLYGGYHRIAMCAARGAGAYTVYRDDHWSLANSDLFYGDQIGAGLPLLGYENDGCPIKIENGLPAPDGGLGVPQNMEIVAIAPATLFEPPDNPFDPMIPPEMPEVLAAFAHGSSDEEAIARLRRGHAVMASFAKGRGEVFNAGTTEWAHGLAEDPFVAKITSNVLDRFLGRETG